MQSRICKGFTIVKVALISIMLIISMMAGSLQADALTVSQTTGQINASAGAILRSSASIKSQQLAVLKDNTKVVINKEVFTSKTSTKKTKKWYNVTVNGKTGFVRSDLIDNISYGQVSVKTTAKLNYRKGPGSKMKKKGTFKKGKTLTAVLAASPKGDGTTWYKIKKGTGYVYVSGKYVKEVAPTTAAAPTNTTVAAAAPTTVSTAPEPQPDVPLSFSITDLRVPELTYTRLPFGLKGIITATHNIESAEVGVIDANGNWVIREAAAVGSTTFNISTVDSKIKFGTLAAGFYTYRVNVLADGEWSTQVDQPFEVRQSTMPQQLTDTALSLTWPLGTSSAYYKYSGGSATEAFNYALNTYFPNRSSWSTAPKKGASCDVFIGTTIRASGYDPDFPRGWDDQYAYLQTSDKWKKISYSGDLADLQTGDLILYKRSSGGNHICMYVVINGQGYLAEAQIEKYYGFINSSLSKIQKFSDKKYLVVYRAAM